MLQYSYDGILYTNPAMIMLIIEHRPVRKELNLLFSDYPFILYISPEASFIP